MNEAIKILYIDDNPMDRALVRQSLNRGGNGFELIEASSREQLENSLKREDFEVILSDFEIGGFDGLDVIDLVRARRGQVPIVVITGSGSEEIAVEAMKRGVADYLLKNPKSLEKLPQILRLAIESNRLREGREEALRQLEQEKKAWSERERDWMHQIEAASKELESFAYSVSHDLRAPLRAMEGFARIIAEDYSKDLPEEAKSYLNIVLNSAGAMNRLMDDLLGFSRLNRVTMELEPLNMQEMVNDIVRQLRAEPQHEKARVKVGELPSSPADAGLMQKLWTHLLSNAFKFSRNEAEPNIEVGAYDAGSETVYYVKDNGVGFDMQYASKLFGLFQRLHRADEFDGTGVGLATVQRIIHRHHGRVWADAKPKEGATFFFSLPKR